MLGLDVELADFCDLAKQDECLEHSQHWPLSGGPMVG